MESGGLGAQQGSTVREIAIYCMLCVCTCMCVCAYMCYNIIKLCYTWVHGPLCSHVHMHMHDTPS